MNSLHSILHSILAPAACWLIGGGLYYIYAPKLLSAVLALVLTYGLLPALNASIIVSSSIIASAASEAFYAIALQTSHILLTPLCGAIIGFLLCYPISKFIGLIPHGGATGEGCRLVAEEGPDREEQGVVDEACSVDGAYMVDEAFPDEGGSIEGLSITRLRR